MTTFALETTYNFDRALESGSLFTASHVFLNVSGSTGEVLFRITTTTKSTAVHFQAQSLSHMWVHTYLNSTYSDDGSESLVTGRNFGIPYSPLTQTKYAPTVATLGDLKVIQNVAGGDRNNTSVGSYISNESAFILPPNTDLLFKVTNLGVNADVGVCFNFVELNT